MCKQTGYNKKLLDRFTKKNCKIKNQNGFRVEKVIKRKGGKLYVKWRGCDNSFNNWMVKKTQYNHSSQRGTKSHLKKHSPT